MKKFNILHIPVLSFFSKELYREVGLKWRGTGVGYLFLLLLVCWLITVIKVQFGFVRFINHEAPEVIAQVPEITINNGKLSIDKPQPYYIKDPDTGKNVFAIDTTGEITNIDNNELMGLVTRNKAIFRKGKYETRTYELNGIKHFVLNQKKIHDWENIFLWCFPFIFFFFCFTFSFIYRLIQMLIYACIGLLFTLMLQRQLTYPALLRLTSVAVTPVIVLCTIMEFLPIKIPFFWFFCFGIAMAYLFFGVFSCETQEDSSLQTQEENIPSPPSENL